MIDELIKTAIKSKNKELGALSFSAERITHEI
jgi:hypothetical protein